MEPSMSDEPHSAVHPTIKSVKLPSAREAAILGIKFKPARESGIVAITAMALGTVAGDILLLRVALLLDDPIRRGAADFLFELDTFGLAALILAPVILLALASWQYSVHKNVRALGSPRPIGSPAWSIWSWLLGPLLLLAIFFLHWGFGRSYDPNYKQIWSTPWTVAAYLTGVPSVMLPFLLLWQIALRSDSRELGENKLPAAPPATLFVWWGFAILGYLLTISSAGIAALPKGRLFVAAIVATIQTVAACAFILQINKMQSKRNNLLHLMKTTESLPAGKVSPQSAAEDEFPLIPGEVAASDELEGPMPTPWLDS
jgi:hypothetical protein